jgi:hypothetical protein
MSDLLHAVIDAHGGAKRWHEIDAVDVTLNFSGGLLDLKGFENRRPPT